MLSFVLEAKSLLRRCSPAKIIIIRIKAYNLTQRPKETPLLRVLFVVLSFYTSSLRVAWAIMAIFS